MSRRTYIFVGPPGSAEVVMTIIEATLGGSFIRDPGSDPYLRADPVTIYVSGHNFDDRDIESPAGTPVPLQSAYPHLIDIRDIERDLQRQQATATWIFSAIKHDGRVKAVYIDDMQHVVETYDPHPGAAG